MPYGTVNITLFGYQSIGTGYYKEMLLMKLKGAYASFRVRRAVKYKNLTSRSIMFI